MHRFYFHRLGLCDEQTDTPQTTAGGETKLTIGQQIKAALAAKADLQAKIAAHESTIAERDASIATKDAEITKLKADLAARDAKITSLEADAAAVNAALEAHKTEVAALKTKDSDLDKRAEAKAKEKVAALGFPASKLPAADAKVNGESSYADALQEYAKITDPAKAADFYAKSIQPHLDNPRGSHGLN